MAAAEKIVSPGVFTREKDLSFLPQGISEIGAAIVGPFKAGPAFLPTVVTSQAEFERIYGTPDGTYYPAYAVQSYLKEAGTVTVARVGGLGGYTQTAAILLKASSSLGENIIGAFFNTKTTGSPLTGFSGSTIAAGANDGTFYLSSGSWAYSGSLVTGSANYLTSVFGEDALGSRETYTYVHWKRELGDLFQSGSVTVTIAETLDQAFTSDITFASTPWFRSQLVGNARFDLFRFHTLSDGAAANTDVKISIQDIKAAGSIQGIDYGQFTIVVRKFNDTDAKINILETFSGVNLDPTSANYVGRVIGDRSYTVASDGKITENGNWANNSSYVRIELKDITEYSVASIPSALAAMSAPILATTGGLIPALSYTSRSVADTTTYSGVDFLRADSKNFNRPTPVGAGTGSNNIFCLDSSGSNETSTTTALTLDLTLTTAAEVAKRKFTVGFQGGTNGVAPNIPINLEASMSSTNSQGLDLSSSTASGSVAYKRCLDVLANPDLYDINLLSMPGVVRRLHTVTAAAGVTMVEARGDTFYIMDLTAQSDTIAQAQTQADAVDTSYAGSYYPWVKIIDVNTNKLTAVPPSTLLPAIYAANDRVAAEWFAPAGLNRGGITEAVQVMNRLTHAERDTLYDNRINPIAVFPGQGISAWGQKTLQAKPSALDRINVRRLLIGMKKFIASTTRFLVFEQNTTQTRSRFLNIVTPFLEQVQQRQGLYAFRVVMDETNNTPDVIDRNILYGQIYLQPTKTAEFIVIDFNVLPTGASFSQ